ncbi:oligosaccharide flippase family protein [Cohnella sp. CFH 77786]|uniref:flippase n=1 Tax=Cohnella sp. CFH 77786 TaxID=2662265 RepID=UPI001C60D3A0|nr:flippase [Cohnella sp. CFH 77786]MBW5448390.1 oligosaccharide flippase family protein [Cohnella sp. CFH 77786]
MTKRRSTLFHILTTFATRIVVLGAGFILSVLTARLLGPESKGLLAAISVLPQIVLTIADLGIRQASAQFIGKRLYPQEDIASSLMLLWLFTSIFSMLTVAGLFLFQFGSGANWLLLGMALATIPLNLGAQYLRGLMQGKERISSMNTVEIVKVFLNIALILLAIVLFPDDVLGVLLASAFVGIYTVYYSVKIVKKDMPLKFKYVPQLPKRLISKGFAFAAALFILQLNYRIGVVMVGHYSTEYDVGIYSLGTNFAELIWQIPAAIAMVMFARSANSRTDAEAVERTAKLLRVVFPLLLVLGAALWIGAPLIVSILYGNAYLPSVSVIRYLLPGIVFFVIAKLIHNDVAARGNPLFGLMLALGPLILTIVLNVFLIPAFGTNGAAVSSSVSYTVASVLFLVAYSRKEKIPIRKIILIERSDWNEVVLRVRGARRRLQPVAARERG